MIFKTQHDPLVLWRVSFYIGLEDRVVFWKMIWILSSLFFFNFYCNNHLLRIESSKLKQNGGQYKHYFPNFCLFLGKTQQTSCLMRPYFGTKLPNYDQQLSFLYIFFHGTSIIAHFYSIRRKNNMIGCKTRKQQLKITSQLHSTRPLNDYTGAVRALLRFLILFSLSKDKFGKLEQEL